MKVYIVLHEDKWYQDATDVFDGVFGDKDSAELYSKDQMDNADYVNRIRFYVEEHDVQSYQKGNNND